MPLTYLLAERLAPTKGLRRSTISDRCGVTAVELMVVTTIIGLLTAIGIPELRRTLDQADVRAARADLTTFTALARAAAVQRGCRSVLHFASGGSSRVWITACPRYAPGAGSVDTVVPLDDLQSRYHVSLTAGDDSVQFDPRGLRIDYGTTVVRFTGMGSTNADSVTINPLGKAVRP